MTGTSLRIGFACEWVEPEERTWSHIPTNLRAALRQQIELVDLPVNPSSLVGRGLRWAVRESVAAGAAPWVYSPVQARTAEHNLRRHDRSQLDAVLQISDCGRVEQPYWLYQDLNCSLLEQLHRSVDPLLLGQGGVTVRNLQPRRRWQERVYAGASGVFAMSSWLKDHLVSEGLVEAERVTVVGAGMNAPLAPRQLRPSRRPHKVLFVGRELARKGGDIVVAATRLLREADPSIVVTIAGPPMWPLPGDPPPGVVFVGEQSREQVAQLFDENDVFAMPSRFEPFGIVFCEALARGLPVVARRAFAMPEIVTEGRDGVLVDSDDPAETAAAVLRCLTDEELRSSCWDARTTAAERWSWSHVAAQMINTMSVEVARPRPSTPEGA